MFQEGIGTAFCVAENRCLAWLLGQGQPCNFKFNRLGAEADEKETGAFSNFETCRVLNAKFTEQNTHTRINKDHSHGTQRMQFATWKCLTRALPPSIAPNIASVTCSICMKWGALRWRAGTLWVLGNLRPDVSPCEASPWHRGSCKVRFSVCLGSDQGCSKATIGTQFWCRQWQINLGIFIGTDWYLNCDSWHSEKVFQAIL